MNFLKNYYVKACIKKLPKICHFDIFSSHFINFHYLKALFSTPLQKNLNNFYSLD